MSELVSSLNFIWNPQGYFFWLLIVSAFCFLLERVAPWRQNQKLLRRGLGQDVFYLVFNGHYAGMWVAMVGAWLFGEIMIAANLPWPLESWNVAAQLPTWLQFIIFLVLKDFLEWMIHIMLHRVPWLWQFHKVHHSIKEMDWIGNFRFHTMEIVVYRSLTWFPLFALGIDGKIILAVDTVMQQ